MEGLQPEEGAGDQEGLNLGAPEVVDQAVPIPVDALLGVGVFVEGGAIELCETVGVCGKMGRHPVEDHTDPRPMAGVHKPREPLGRAEAGARGELRQRLITPRAAERMLHDRQELQVGEAHVHPVGNQALDQPIPVEHPFRVAVRSKPGGEVNLIDRQGSGGGLRLQAPGHPGGVGPGEIQGGGDDRSGGRGLLRSSGQGIGLLHRSPRTTDDFELVPLAGGEAGDEQLPHPGFVAKAHRVAAPVPAIEVAHDGNPPGVGGPD